MIDLDDLTTLRSNDRGQMGRLLSELPKQCGIAWEIIHDWSPPGDYRDFNAVVILGMGGSAIGGDLLCGIVSETCPVPIQVIRDYRLPQSTGPRSLVIASSYSGDTEETLFGFQEALQRGAKSIAVTTGGKLAQLATEGGTPLVAFDYPSPPRAATGFSLVLLLGILYRLGLIPDPHSDLEEGIDLLLKGVSQLCEEVPSEQNLAKRIARQLAEHIPIIWGAEHLYPVARRWKTQINENAKATAFYEAIPEVHHNAVVGLRYPDTLAEKIYILILNSSLYHPRNLLRVKVTSEVLDREGIPYQLIAAQGESRLAQTLGALLLGDYVSLYLAALNGIDPSSTEVISHIKKRMAEGWK